MVAGAASAEAGAVPLFDDAAGDGFTVPEGDVGLRAPPDEFAVCGGVVLVPGDVADGVSGCSAFGRGGGAGCGWRVLFPTLRSPVVTADGAAGWSSRNQTSMTSRSLSTLP